jgi:homoserine O-acetyltransferase
MHAWVWGERYPAFADGLVPQAMGMLFIMTSAPKVQHRQAPTRDQADSAIRAYLDANTRGKDANDVIYQFEASRTYDPSKDLEKITAHVLSINSADDFVNPPELEIVEPLMKRVTYGRFIVLPITDQTRGHGTHSAPAIWKNHLAEFMKSLPPR